MALNRVNFRLVFIKNLNLRMNDYSLYSNQLKLYL